jgi:hypothetical protein
MFYSVYKEYGNWLGKSPDVQFVYGTQAKGGSVVGVSVL